MTRPKYVFFDFSYPKTVMDHPYDIQKHVKIFRIPEKTISNTKYDPIFRMVPNTKSIEYRTFSSRLLLPSIT